MMTLLVDGEQITAQWSHGIHDAVYHSWPMALAYVLHTRNMNIRFVRVRSSRT